MLDLRNMTDEEFSIIVTPSTPQTAMQITINESGKVAMSGKLAQKFSKKPVQLRFNRDFSAIQLEESPENEEYNSITFPKNGRKTIANATELLKENRIPLPAVFQGYCLNDTKWRGERQQNPTMKSSSSTRNAKKK